MKRNKMIMVVGLPFSGKEEWVISHSSEFPIVTDCEEGRTAGSYYMDKIAKLCEKGKDFILSLESCIAKNFRGFYVGAVSINYPNYDIEVVSFLNVPVESCIECIEKSSEDKMKIGIDGPTISKSDMIQRVKWMGCGVDRDFTIPDQNGIKGDRLFSYKNILEFS